MTPEQFARGVAAERDAILQIYFKEPPTTAVGQQIEALKLSKPQLAALRQILNGALTDMCYALLLGLDGAASIGNLRQQEFQLADAEGDELTGGELEAAASEVFQEDE